MEVIIFPAEKEAEFEDGTARCDRTCFDGHANEAADDLVGPLEARGGLPKL
jgi:hypothetical protein